MADKRNENLAKNTLIFAIGSFGSKLLQFFLVPFYTRVMAEGEYGTTDILQAIVSLLLPVFSLTIYESVFRYAMEKDQDRTSVFSTGFFVTLAGSGVLVFAGLGYFLFPTQQYLTLVWLVIANTVFTAMRSLLSQYARAINRSMLFTIDNLLLTGLVLVLNIFFIAVMHWGISGYMLGYICANALSCVFLFVMLGKDRKIKLSSVSKSILKTMLVFSIPLIPNAICWWISNFTDRIMITSMISIDLNGLYAAAHKIPSLLSMVVTVFFQAWQISANEEFRKKDIAAFYSDIFEQISACIFVLSSLLIVFCKPITNIFLGKQYASAWLFMPVLLLAMTFFSYAQFLGSIYSANKKTTPAFVTNLIAVVVNVVLNYLLISTLSENSDHIGTLGAGIATAVSYLVLWIIRIINTHGIVPMKYNILRVSICTAVLIAQTVFVTLALDTTITYIACGAGTLLIIEVNTKTLIKLVKFALSLVGKILHRGNADA